jgi:hypothetical protein
MAEDVPEEGDNTTVSQTGFGSGLFILASKLLTTPPGSSPNEDVGEPAVQSVSATMPIYGACVENQCSSSAPTTTPHAALVRVSTLREGG